MGRQRPSSPEAPPDEATPSLECDLVMKGGVTSGIVYPGAIAEIARHYRLRSLGGTSAGAIGAAAAAAMEFGRLSGQNSHARDQLAEVAAELGHDVGGAPLLLRLFEPDPDTADLFHLGQDIRGAATAGGLSGVLRYLFGQPLILAVLIALLVSAGLSAAMEQPIGWASVVAVALLFFCSTILLTGVFALWKLLPRIRNGLAALGGPGFGFCSGMSRHKGETPALNEWLHKSLQSLAGLAEDEPLCFGDLWVASQRRKGRPRTDVLSRASMAPDQNDLEALRRDVDLTLIASDITRAQSVQLPFLRREDRIYANIDDLKRTFPPAIVQWLVDHAGESKLDEVDTGGFDKYDFIRLPPAQDLPILFAVRMSMSFPLLFRAVRLYVVRRNEQRRSVLSELWLADGGITSNFPVHLFDSPIPSRPTFCLNLLYHDDELEPDDRGLHGDQAAANDQRAEVDGLGSGSDKPIYMLRTNSGRLAPYTPLSPGSVSGLFRYVMRLVTTARQWGDNQLVDTPGYRDRIVHIRMAKDEGGFNLGMDAAKIADLQKRGERAGDLIARRFLPTTLMDPLRPKEKLTLNWANHRMVRFRSFLAGLEMTAAQFVGNWRLDLDRAETPADAPGHAEPSLHEMMKNARPRRQPASGQRTGYPFRSDAQAGLGDEMVMLIERLADLSSGAVQIDFVKGRSSSPRPKQKLALRPGVGSDPLADRPAKPV